MTGQLSLEGTAIVHGLRRVLANAMLLAGFRIAADVALLLFYISLSRRFGAHGLGLYAYGMALSSTLFSVPGFAFATFLIRSGSASDDDYARLWPAARRLCQIGLAIASLPVAIAAGLLPWPDPLVIVAIGCGQLFYFGAEIYRGPFAVHERLGQIAFAELVFKGSITISGVILILFGAPLPLVLSAFPISGLIYYILVRTLSRPFQPRRTEAPASVRQAFHEAVPFLTTTLVEAPIYRQYPLLLTWFSSIAASGLFSAAFKPVETGLLCLGYLNMALLPTLTRMEQADGRGHARLFRQALLMVAAVATAGAVAGVVLAPWIINLLFGRQFAAAVPVLRLLCAAIIAASLKRVFITRLASSNHITQWRTAQASTLLAGLVAGLALIPWDGAIGAAIALTIGEVAGCATAYVFVRAGSVQ